MQTLTKEYIQEQDQKTCEALLKQILKDPKIFKPLMHHPELVKEANDIANNLAYLEDRIAYLTQLTNLEKANNARWGRVAEEPQL
jgi:Na+-translocating ferredoxin:NAD+ oxidoreductase RnfG subunit